MVSSFFFLVDDLSFAHLRHFGNLYALVVVDYALVVLDCALVVLALTLSSLHGLCDVLRYVESSRPL